MWLDTNEAVLEDVYCLTGCENVKTCNQLEQIDIEFNALIPDFNSRSKIEWTIMSFQKYVKCFIPLWISGGRAFPDKNEDTVAQKQHRTPCTRLISILSITHLYYSKLTNRLNRRSESASRIQPDGVILAILQHYRKTIIVGT